MEKIERLEKQEKEKPNITKIRNKTRKISIDLTGFEKIVRDIMYRSFASKFENLYKKG